MRRLLKLVLVALLITAAAGTVQAQQKMKLPFGSPPDVPYAKQLWTAMEAQRLVDPNSISTTIYKGGTAPHTETLITLQGNVTINGNTGLAIVKKNFGKGKDAATEAQVFADPQKHLKILTVMYRREKGFDTANKD